MRTEEANKLIDKAIEIVDKKGLDQAALEKVLKEAREFAKKEEDPLITKTLRLIYEYIDENEAFDVEVSIQDEEDEDEEFEQEEMTDTENLKYLLELIKKSDNAYNREEIKGYRTELWNAIY